MIATTPALVAFLEGIGTPTRIAVDTEADSMHCYFEKLCLIQVSVPGQDVLIDPLSPELNLEPLFNVLRGSETVLHGADYDLRLLRRAGLADPGTVFDTMIAARLTGHREFSLAALISKNFGYDLPKGSQKANWARRPLSPAMEEYARNDTKFLLELAAILEAELKRLDRFDWFRQSCQKAVDSALQARERDPEQVWRISGSSKLAGRTAAILRELWRWRDEEARRVDRPAFHVFQNDRLLEAAVAIDQDRSVTLQKMSASRQRRFEEAAARGREMAASDWPKPLKKGRPRPAPEVEARVKELRKSRDRVAEELNLEGSIIATKSALEAVAMNREEGLAQLLPWQRALLESAGI